MHQLHISVSSFFSQQVVTKKRLCPLNKASTFEGSRRSWQAALSPFFFFEERLIPKLEPANNCFWWKVLDIALRPERGLVFTLQYQPLKKTIQSSIILLIRGDCLHNALTFLTKSLPILLFTLSKSLKNRAVEGMVDMLALSKKLNMRRSNKEI